MERMNEFVSQDYKCWDAIELILVLTGRGLRYGVPPQKVRILGPSRPILAVKPFRWLNGDPAPSLAG
jgi:hypothetical protein